MEIPGTSYAGGPYVQRRAVMNLLVMIVAAVLLLLVPSVTSQVSQKRVSVSEVVFDSAVHEIQWASSDHMTVLVLTHKGRLYRSVNGGKSWGEITDVLRGLVSSDTSVSQTVLVDSVVVNPVDKNVVLVVGQKHAHFISEDAGRTFRRLRPQTPIHSWQFHPTNPSWALFSAWSPSCDKGTQDTSPCVHMLHATKDLGKTFQQVVSYVVQFSWGDVKNQQADRIYFTHHRVKEGNQLRYGGWLKSVDFACTDDFGGKITRLVYRGNKFLSSDGYIFVAKLADVVRQTVVLMASTDGAASFHEAQVPSVLHHKSYTILDTSEGTVMLHVNHEEQAKADTGNVYISDASGERFALSLPNNVRSRSGECEFDKVLSVDGVYLANFKDDAMSEDGVAAEDEVDEEEVDTQPDAAKKAKKKGKSEDVVKTVISFDKGGAWRYLKAPSVDSAGNPITCPPDRCWLHLHGVTNYHNYAPFYSLENAVGLIIGTGNVGPYLRYEGEEVNTYLSRDGGVTWVEAHKGAYIYELGDHGGLIVMADDQKKTSQVVFSWNEGQSWYDFELSDKLSLEVDNIVIEPNSSAVEFLLYGTRGDSGVLYHLDFGALQQPACKGVWAADSVSSDYEWWKPSDGSHSERCILGRELRYTRRKQAAECFNGRDFQRPFNQKNCTCTQYDYECEFRFTRLVNSLECRAEDETLTSPSCTTSQFFYMDAYRKVPGDTCVGGWVPEKVAVPCPQTSPFSRGALSVLFVIFGIAILLGGMTILSRIEQFKGYFKQYGFDTFNNVRYSALGKRPETCIDAHHFDDPDDFDDDEHEEDAPRLQSISTARERDRSSMWEREMESTTSEPTDLIS